jgi:hypothetical protein
VPVSEITTTVQSAVLDSIESTQKLVLDGLKNVADYVKPLVESIPELPLSENLPTPSEIVENNYAFAQKLLKSQHEFATQVIAAFRPTATDV